MSAAMPSYVIAHTSILSRPGSSCGRAGFSWKGCQVISNSTPLPSGRDWKRWMALSTRLLPTKHHGHTVSL